MALTTATVTDFIGITQLTFVEIVLLATTITTLIVNAALLYEIYRKHQHKQVLAL